MHAISGEHADDRRKTVGFDLVEGMHCPATDKSREVLAIARLRVRSAFLSFAFLSAGI
jgi:hypothetical protein